MLIRRCAILVFEAREHLEFDLATLFAGDQALAAACRWVALAAHLDAEVELSDAELALLRSVGESLWVERAPLDQAYGAEAVDAMLRAGLLLAFEGGPGDWRARDEAVRESHWRPLPALAHAFSRWSGQDVASDPRLSRFKTIRDMVQAFGPPPPETVARGPAAARVALPAPAAGPLDGPLFGRYTGRNYDPAGAVPLATASRLLQRTFGAQQVREIAEGTAALKKTSPSGGSLHPIEAYVLAQRVEGVAPGFYHYHPVAHALEPLQALEPAAARAHALAFVAGQEWFADAPLLVVMAPRWRRNFWKYRNHAKAHRAILMDAGHLSQTFYLLAAEAGLPAFVTAAVNEIDISAALGLDPVRDGVIAVCGCGPDSGEQVTVEYR
ncbi:MAG TPA: putative peptide maturation dehydrogenase [Arenimonas sp.]|uniref:putative peptide maturation dehydrogenase n=1 Tax=Arenimonas sp. TaxID=1872635 RepID=UPI002D7E998B|nr:putative peptide maturation dehydrogenase [Arenimonas sp.]HEU0153148.1 putative peptide maturation dehydrogenase [Arenimonas sp.]